MTTGGSEIYYKMCLYTWEIHRTILAGGFNPSEKYESVGIIIPNIWTNKKCSKPPTRHDDAGTIGNLPQTDPWVFFNDSPEPVVDHAHNPVKREKNRWLRVRSFQANPANQGMSSSVPLNEVEEISILIGWRLQVLFLLAILAQSVEVATQAKTQKPLSLHKNRETFSFLPSGNLSCYWKWLFIVDFPIKNCDFP